MRIISGSWRGQTLKVPAQVRPTADRVKEAIFSILGNAGDLKVLDLYAGSGALGLEALSRGARRAQFVDLSRRALATIKDNLRGHDSSNVILSQQDALEFLRKAKQPFDWIFCDPPYHKVSYLRLLQAIGKSEALGADSLLILESDRFHTFELPPTLQAIDRRKFGDTIIHFIKRAAAGFLDDKRRA
jgi:16S rRNA (guanine(966)-N(2))-methyltransferase RsmD